jgi:hypothetical protein
MAGLVMALAFHRRYPEAGRMASELTALVESIGDPTLSVARLFVASFAKQQEAGEMSESLRLAQRVIDLADGDPTRGNIIYGSPLAMAIGMRGFARQCLGIIGWQHDSEAALLLRNNIRDMVLRYISPVAARKRRSA